MADRKLTGNERPGTFIQHYTNGETGVIIFATYRGYTVNWITSRQKGFIPYNKLDDYVVIE